jgi:hypothetical protein
MYRVPGGISVRARSFPIGRLLVCTEWGTGVKRGARDLSPRDRVESGMAMVPQPAPSREVEPPPPQDIVITVLPDGTVRLNQEPVNVTDLRQRLTLLVTTATDHIIFVRGEKGLEFRAVAEVIDIANGAGFNRVALMTE